MAINQINKIDFVSVDDTGAVVVLTISDHLDWVKPMEHLMLLQQKVNTYISFIENGDLSKSYPSALGKDITVNVVAKYEVPEIGNQFFEHVNEILEKLDVKLTHRILRG